MTKKKKNQPLFGAPLPNTPTIPFPLEKFVEFYTMRGITVEGIFRITGNMDAIEKLKKKLDKGKNIDISLENPHVIASLMKLYFRELPEPLFTFTSYDSFLSAVVEDDDTKTVQNVKQILKTLPEPNRVVIRYLFEFLHRVTQNAEVNKMHANNLAIVFAPTLLRSSDPTSLISSSSDATKLVETMISHFNETFKDEPLPSLLSTFDFLSSFYQLVILFVDVKIKESWNKPKDNSLVSQIEQELVQMKAENFRSLSLSNINTNANSSYLAESVQKRVANARPVSEKLGKPAPPPRRDLQRYPIQGTRQHSDQPRAPGTFDPRSRPQSMKIHRQGNDLRYTKPPAPPPRNMLRSSVDTGVRPPSRPPMITRTPSKNCVRFGSSPLTNSVPNRLPPPIPPPRRK